MPESLPASFSLAGRVALVTGSTTGLGRCMAKALGQAGAKVALNYANNAQRAQEAFAEFQAAGLQGALFQADVTDEAQVQRMVSEIRSTLGPVDIMVLNATCDQPQKPIEEYDWAFYQRMVDFGLGHLDKSGIAELTFKGRGPKPKRNAAKSTKK